MGGIITPAGWQVTLYDPIWHVSSRSGAVLVAQTAIRFITRRHCDCSIASLAPFIKYPDLLTDMYCIRPAAAVLTASQCFNSQLRIPKVMFGCASPSHMIKILRAFHGVRASGDDVIRSRQCDDVSGDPLCSYCPGDCVDDSINEVSACVSAL